MINDGLTDWTSPVLHGTKTLTSQFTPTPMMKQSQTLHDGITPALWLDGEQDNFLVGPQEPLLATPEMETHMVWAGYNSLSKPILQGTFEGWGHCGGQLVSWRFEPSQPEMLNG